MLFCQLVIFYHPFLVFQQLLVPLEVLALGLFGIDELEVEPVVRMVAGKLAAAAQPAPPGNAEIYDQALLDHPAFAALLLCISDGSIGPGATPADMKAAIVAKM